MKLLKPVEKYFVDQSLASDTFTYYRYKLLLNASIFTSLFSFCYLFISVLIEFQPGIHFMIFNVAGFLLLPFLIKARVNYILLGNIYILIGTMAVVILIYYSGGKDSPVFPWLAVPPVLALLIVNRFYAYVWTGITLSFLTVFMLYAWHGQPLKTEYNTAWSILFISLCSSGIILIIVMISMIFENNMRNALAESEANKKELAEKNSSLITHQEELLTTTEQLQELHEKKDYLLEIIAHDLKSPLANIQALIGLLKIEGHAIDSTERQVIDLIVDSSKKAQRLIQKILSSENLENLTYDLNFKPHDITAIIKDAITEVRELASKKNINIHFIVEEDKEYLAFTDKVYLLQVYENLLNNAIKFSPLGKHIYVTVNISDHTIRTEVKDEGPGIPKEEMTLLFKKFKKLSNKPTAGESSTGLGLSIVKHYTVLLNGKVWCESAPGEGSNFIVELPIHE
jgi:signal transduction histidine kinase